MVKWQSGQVAAWLADWPKGGANTERVVRINYGIKLASGIGATAAASATALQLQHPRQDLPLSLALCLSKQVLRCTAAAAIEAAF